MRFMRMQNWNNAARRTLRKMFRAYERGAQDAANVVEMFAEYVADKFGEIDYARVCHSGALMIERNGSAEWLDDAQAADFVAYATA